MIHSDAKSLRERGDHLFSAKRTWDSRNQELADHFYPERADFTVMRDVGDEFADHLMTGYPAMVRRDLGDSLGSMLRPRGQQWFHIRAEREEQEDHEGKEWLEYASGVMRRAMYDRKSMFSRATKEGDFDFATFGGCAISTEINRRDQSLLYRCWHLRDMAWAEDSYGQLCEFHRNWQPGARELVSAFPKTVHQKVRECAEKEPFRKIKVRHAVVRSDAYGGGKFRQPWVSIFIDCENDTILEERGNWTKIYTLPRFATVSCSPYPYSPAAIIALPDARLLQSMTLTILDAGERSANPPMVGVAEAIRGDLNLYPGGFTAVDAAYDERLGEVLRPISQDRSGMPVALEMNDRVMAQLSDAFYLNKLSMPPAGGPEMTAFEVGQRVQEYIRQALPLFEPMESEYNGQLCEITFETLMQERAFGPIENIPQSIQGREVGFAFESPLAEMIERQKGQRFLEAKAMIVQALDIEPNAPLIMDGMTTLRDVLSGVQTPTKWLNSPEEVDAAIEQKQAMEQAAAMAATMQQGAETADTLGSAAQKFGVTQVV